MDIHDIKRLPTQFDQVQSKGPASSHQAQDVQVEPANSADSPKVDNPQQSNVAASEPTAQANDVEAAVEKLREHAQNMSHDLQFQVDTETGNTVVKILDPATQEIVRQIPSEEVLALTKNLKEVQGMLFNSKA